MQLGVITATLVLVGAASLPAQAQNYMRPVVKVPGAASDFPIPADPPPAPQSERQLPLSDAAPPEDTQVQCISIDDIRDSVIRNDRTIHLRMRGNLYYEMRLQNTCPGLSFYDGFYYRTTPNRQLCGGLDMIMARSGSRCPIESFTRIEKEMVGKPAGKEKAAKAKASKEKAPKEETGARKG